MSNIRREEEEEEELAEHYMNVPRERRCFGGREVGYGEIIFY